MSVFVCPCKCDPDRLCLVPIKSQPPDHSVLPLVRFQAKTQASSFQSHFMALADTLFNSLQGGLLDLLQNVEKQYKTKFQDQEETIKRLQERVDELETQEQLDQIERKYQSPIAQDDNQDDSQQIQSPRIDEKDDHEEEEENDDRRKASNFWSDISKALEDSNIEFIKNLLRRNEIKMDEINDSGRNLLMLAAEFGSYELASMCINLGANIDAEDYNKMTALKVIICFFFILL